MGSKQPNVKGTKLLTIRSFTRCCHQSEGHASDNGLLLNLSTPNGWKA